MDKEFCAFHAKAPGVPGCSFAPNDLSRLPNVTNDFAAILIQKFPQHNKKLLKRFSRFRSHIRKRRIKQIIFEREQETMRSKRKKLEYVYAKNPENKDSKIDSKNQQKKKKTPAKKSKPDQKKQKKK